MNSIALVPQALLKIRSRYLREFVAVFGGVLMVSLLAQVALPLPWTPVPLTGQTFGVFLMAFLWGKNRSLVTMLVYLALGGLGAPVFSLGTYGLFGPTLGYLVGMLIAAAFIGAMVEAGVLRSRWLSLAVAIGASVIVYIFGVAGLSFFIPGEQLLLAGVAPFILGDLIKGVLVVELVRRLQS